MDINETKNKSNTSRIVIITLVILLFLAVILRIAYVRFTDYMPIMPPIDVDTAISMLATGD